MQLTKKQYVQIADIFTRHRGNVDIDNLSALNAILYVLENGCKWRRLPKKFGNWHTIYTRMSRWTKSGVLNRIFTRLQQERLMSIRIEAVSLDSSYIKVHPDACGAFKKTALKASASPEKGEPVKFIWLPQVLNLR